MVRKRLNFKNFTLTDRDLDILLYLAKKGISTRRNLHSLFWTTDIKSNAHHKRLKRLIDAGFLIHTCKYSQGSPLKLTSIGHKYLKKHLPELYSFNFLHKNYGSEFSHDETLAKVLDVFEQSPCVDNIIHEKDIPKYLTNNKNSSVALKALRKLPDAIIEIYIKNKNRYFAIEIELTQKGRKRYKKIIKQHLISKDWDFILYLFEDPTIEKMIQNTIDDLLKNDSLVRSKPITNTFYFLDLDTFLNKKEAAVFKSKNQNFSLSDIHSWAGL